MKFYLRTKAGAQALQRGDRFADEDAAVLALLDDVAYFDAIAACLPQWSKSRIVGLLDGLQTRRFVESVPMEWVRELCRLADH